MLLLAGINTVAAVAVLALHDWSTVWLPSHAPGAILRSMALPIPDLNNVLTTAFSLSCVIGLSNLPLEGWVRRSAFMIPLIISAATLGLTTLAYLIRKLMSKPREGSNSPRSPLGFITCCAVLGHFCAPIILLYLRKYHLPSYDLLNILTLHLAWWFQTVRGTGVALSATYLLLTTVPQVGCDIVLRSRPKIWSIPAVPMLSMLLVSVGSGLLLLSSPSTGPWKWILALLVFGFGAGLCISVHGLSLALGPSNQHTPDVRVDHKIFSRWFYGWKEHVMSIGTAVAHTLFLYSLRNSVARSSVPGFEDIMLGGASAWKDGKFGSHQAELVNTYSIAFKWTFYYLAAASALAAVLTPLVWAYSTQTTNSRGIFTTSPLFKERASQGDDACRFPLDTIDCLDSIASSSEEVEDTVSSLRTAVETRSSALHVSRRGDEE